jgi:hypothetical protein
VGGVRGGWGVDKAPMKGTSPTPHAPLTHASHPPLPTSSSSSNTTTNTISSDTISSSSSISSSSLFSQTALTATDQERLQKMMYDMDGDANDDDW